ncbi:MAG: DNA internalization-related competence protein ComEC/Rec2 [Gammaproteobacteria bacterium]|jgi:competence protein ComEC
MLQTGTLAFLAGIILLQTRAVLPPAWLIYFLPLLCIGLLIRRWPWFRLLCCLLAGFVWAQYQAHDLMSQRLPKTLMHQNLRVEGVVAGLPQQRHGRTTFVLVIRKIAPPAEKPFPHKVRVSWYTRVPVGLQPGQVWQLTLRLRPPHSFMDPGAFDYTAWLLQQGIVASGYVVAKADNRFVRDEFWSYPVQVLRYRLQQYFESVLVGFPAAGLLRAVLIGDRSGISPGQWRVLRQTGTVHLMAISGLHIGLIAGLSFFLLVRLWRLFPRLCLLLPAPKAAAAFAWLVACFYAALAGFAIPTQRALIMLAVILIALWRQRSYQASQVMALALLVVLVLDPFAVLSIGFWLSFSAVGLIYYLLQFQYQGTARVIRWWRMQWAISLGLLPLLIVFFQQAPLISPITNLLAIPCLSLFILPLALISTCMSLVNPALAIWGLQLAAAAVHLLLTALAWAGNWSGNVLHVPAPDGWTLALALVGIAISLLPRQIPARYLGLVLCLPLIFPLKARPPVGEIRFSLLDVGQGLAAVVLTQNHTLVYDSGPRFSPYFNAGQAVILPYLRQQGVGKLDMLLISHSDLDHRGGAWSLLKTIPVAHVISNVASVIRDDKRDRGCFAGDGWSWDGVQFRVLYPSRAEYEQADKDNNRSCVLQVATPTRRLLLTADIESRAEARLLADYGEKLQSDVLVIPHHGSKTSSTPAFLAAVNPALGLIPSGWQNRFHLPAAKVVDRLQQRSVRLLDTASVGAIELRLGEEMNVQVFRRQYRRYWQTW